MDLGLPLFDKAKLEIKYGYHSLRIVASKHCPTRSQNLQGPGYSSRRISFQRKQGCQWHNLGDDIVDRIGSEPKLKRIDLLIKHYKTSKSVYDDVCYTWCYTTLPCALKNLGNYARSRPMQSGWWFQFGTSTRCYGKWPVVDGFPMFSLLKMVIVLIQLVIC